MSYLRQLAEDYLQIRRALGYKLDSQARVLFSFVSYLEDAGASCVTVDLALSWATQPAGADPVWWSRRLSVARCFARHLVAIDPDTEVPSTHLLARHTRRAAPYPYSVADVAALMSSARALLSPLQAATYETLIGLLAVTGIRVGEAIALNRDDVEVGEGLLVIRNGKFGKGRELPLHPSTLDALSVYDHCRDRLCPKPKTPSWFISTAGTRLVYNSVREVFARLSVRAGLQARSARCRPRIHDLRHRFAVETLLEWYRSGVDVAARLPLLSTYMGHAKPTKGTQTVFA